MRRNDITLGQAVRVARKWDPDIPSIPIRGWVGVVKCVDDGDVTIGVEPGSIPASHLKMFEEQGFYPYEITLRPRDLEPVSEGGGDG